MGTTCLTGVVSSQTQGAGSRFLDTGGLAGEGNSIPKLL